MLNFTLTEKAIRKMTEIICAQENPEQIQGVRISVVGGGCAGFSYYMEFITEPTPQKDQLFPDKILELDSVKPNGEPFKLKVFIDLASILYLDGASVDYVEMLQGSGFQFNNPSAIEKCSCGQSFRI